MRDGAVCAVMIRDDRTHARAAIVDAQRMRRADAIAHIPRARCARAIYNARAADAMLFCYAARFIMMPRMLIRQQSGRHSLYATPADADAPMLFEATTFSCAIR